MVKLPPHLRVEADEASDLRAYLRKAGYQFVEAPGRNPSHRYGNRVAKGQPDFVICGKPGQPDIAIELKRRDGGSVTAKQLEALRQFRDKGCLAAVCFGADDAIAALKAMGRP